MATYVPNATQITEPVESRTVESAALEFRTLKESVNTRIAALTADFDALEAVVTAEDAKDLRVPEATVAPLPAIAVRAGKVLAFDAGGNPTVLAVGDSADSSLRADLAASSGSSLVGYDGGTVQDVLDGAKSLQDYAALRAYTGSAKRVYITGTLVTSKPSGIAGVFQYDQTDTTSTDNGGTIIVGADGRRWKRDFSGAVNIGWFGAVGNPLLADDTAAIQAAINSLPLNTGSPGVLEPLGFANGGEVLISRGRHKVSAPIVLRRGVRIVGESKEASQIISFISAGDVLQYLDAGRYTPDEIVVEHLSIWQDASVVHTSGAGININTGPAAAQAVCWTINSVHIEGTHRGFVGQAGIGSSIHNSSSSKTVSHGFEIEYAGAVQVTTTSALFKNCYANQSVTGSGFKLTSSGYCGMIACASDANARYGYELVGTGGALSLTSCGAEGNTLAGAYLEGTNSAQVGIRVVSQSGASHGIVLNNASGVTLISPAFTAAAGNTGFAIQRITPRELTVTNPYFDGPYATNKYSSTDRLFQTGFGFIGGATLNYAFGAAVAVPTTALVTYTGLLDTASNHTINIAAAHTGAGASYNAGINVGVATANTAVTYPLVIGSRIPNISKGAASTITRSAGTYIQQQTQGVTANVNIMIDAGAGTVPAGNWNIYSDSTRDNYFKGKLTWAPPSSGSPVNNGDLTILALSDTQISIQLRGSDGVLRGIALTLT